MPESTATISAPGPGHQDPLRPRALGRSGLQTLPLALGGNVFGWTVKQEGAFGILDRFIEAGFSLIDTADVYPKWVPGNVGGESQIMIGQTLKRRRNRDSGLFATNGCGAKAPGRKGPS